MYRLIIFCFIAFLQVHTRCQAQSAHLESNRIFEDDIAILIIEYDSKIPSLYGLDTSTLESDFEVLNIKSGISKVVESHQIFHRMQWQIEILPRHSGRLSVPALKMGELSTPALSLEVVPQSSGLRARQSVVVEAQAQPDDPYIGQLVQVIIRVLHNIPLTDYKLIDVTNENTDVYRSGQDSRYVIDLDGKPFNVLERRIALIAQTPGNISLSPASYRGLIKSDSTGADLAARSRRIHRNSGALQLQVRNLPAEFSGDSWLPARQLEISQHWDDVTGELNVGDSLGFTLTIEAWGLPAKTLPSGLVSVDSDQFRIYADQEIRSNRYENNDLVGRLRQRFAVVVSQPGEILIPATTLKWWDVTQDIERIERLEGKNLTVKNPAGIQYGNGGLTQSRSNLLSATATWLALLDTPRRWLMLTSLILLIAGISISFKPVHNRITTKFGTMVNTRRNLKALKQACLSNDPTRVRRELLQWSRERWPEDKINSLHQIEMRSVSNALVREIYRLDSALYASHPAAWQGQRLWQLIRTECNHHPPMPDVQQNSLPDLYPRHDSTDQIVTR